MVQELDLLKKHQKISVKELAAALGVSEMTVRRDLELLRKNHVLERSYGYATLVEGGNGYSYEGENYDLRRARLENFAEKDRIAKYAASLIRPDDWVFLDNGTTVSRMTFYLPTDFEYTVLCYNFLILAELLKHSNIKVIFPGGYYHPEDYTLLPRRLWSSSAATVPTKLSSRCRVSTRVLASPASTPTSWRTKRP